MKKVFSSKLDREIKICTRPEFFKKIHKEPDVFTQLEVELIKRAKLSDAGVKLISDAKNILEGMVIEISHAK